MIKSKKSNEHIRKLYVHVSVKLYPETHRRAVIALKTYILSEKEYIEHIVCRLREAYKQSLQQSDIKTFLSKVSNGEALKAIKDVSYYYNIFKFFT